MAMLRSAIAQVADARRPFALLNLFYFGIVFSAMAVSLFDRSLQEALKSSILAGVASGPLAGVLGAYQGGHFLSAFLMTFVINLLVGSFAAITLPSLILPFSGLLVAALRALLWGVLFSPPLSGITLARVLAALVVLGVLLLEGEAYVLAMLGAYLQGKALLFPRSVGSGSHWEGFRRGVFISLQIYVLVILTLFAAALYESTVAIVLLPRIL
jgi:hypothetical protein